MENFKVTFSQMVKNPYTAILLAVFGFASLMLSMNLQAKNDELLRETKRLEECIKEKDRINKRLEDIAVTKNLIQNAE